MADSRKITMVKQCSMFKSITAEVERGMNFLFTGEFLHHKRTMFRSKKQKENKNRS